MKEPTSTPPFVVMYPKLADIFRDYGYALAVHGTVARDFDLVAIPWRERTTQPEEVMQRLLEDFGGHLDKVTPKLHGRVCHGFIPAVGGFLDISFMPIQGETR